MPTNPTIGFIGLGLMGQAFTKRLVASGYTVTGFDIATEKIAQATKHGVIAATSSADVTRSSDIVLLCVTSTDAVHEAVFGPGGVMESASADKVLVDHSTTIVESTKDMAHTLHEQTGMGWVDAPVSGGPEGASNGTLAIMAGGTENDFCRVKPILDALGGNVVHVGGPGLGHTVKVINQLIVGLTIETVAEALTLAEKSGVDPRLVQQALKGGFADSKILQLHGSRMIDRSYVPGAKATIQLKDLKLAKALASEAATELPHLASTMGLYEKLIARGDGDLDHSAIHKLL